MHFILVLVHLWLFFYFSFCSKGNKIGRSRTLSKMGNNSVGVLLAGFNEKILLYSDEESQILLSLEKKI